MRIGIESGGYLRRYGTASGAQKMKAHGYDCVDYQGFVDTESEFFKLPESCFKRYLEEEAHIIRAAGITVNQTHGPWRYPPRDFTEEDRAERLESMAKAIRGTAYLGAEHFVIHPIMPFGADSSEHPEQMREINLAFMSKLCDVGREYGVTVCLENMPFRKLPMTTVVHVKDFVRELNDSQLKICLDTGHCLVCGDSPADAVRYVGKELLAALHVHDNDGKEDRHWMPGNGIADWNAFAAVLKEIGFEGVFSFETAVADSGEGDGCEAAEKALAAFGVALVK